MCELVVITNRKLCQGDFLERIRLLCEAGVDKLVLREKDLDEQEYERLAGDVMEICKRYPVKCILHQHLAVAEKLLLQGKSDRKISVDGIHLSVPLIKQYSERMGFLSQVQDDVLEQGSKSKKNWNEMHALGKEQKRILFGVSAHSLEEILLADGCGADYVFYSPVFETSCKPGAVPKGTDALEKICKKSPLPVYALGGILPENAVLCLKAGAAGVCVMSFGMTASFGEISGLGKVCHAF